MTTSLSRPVTAQMPHQIASKQSDLNKSESTSQTVRNLTWIQNSPNRMYKQEDFLAELNNKLASRKSSVKSIDKKPIDQALKPWQKELAELKQAHERSAPDREAAEAKEEARVTTALIAEAAEKAKQEAAKAEKAVKPIATLKFDVKGIPLPPPPPMNMPPKFFNNSNVVNKANVQNTEFKGSEVKNLHAELIKDITAKLAKRASETGIAKKPTIEALKPWQKELAELKKAHERSAPDREAAEAKEEARVTTALIAEAAEKAKQEAAKAEKAVKPIATLKFDVKGIPLPPPPPMNMPPKFFNNSNVVNKANVQNTEFKGSEVKNLHAELIKDITAKLAKRASETGIAKKPTIEALKPWQKELAELKQAHERSAPDREAAEAKEEARVTTALIAEAAEKAKQEAAKAEKAVKPIATLKFDVKGIPLPPPPPMNMPPKFFNNSNVVNKANVQNTEFKGSEVKNLHAELIKDITAKLAKRASETGIAKKPTIEALKPWQKELAELKQAHERSAPERKAAEAKEEARVTTALNAEAAEKAKQKAAEA